MAADPGDTVVELAAAVRAGGFGRREVVIRINGLDTPWGLEDLAAAIDAEAAVIDARPGMVLLGDTIAFPGGGGQLPDRARLHWDGGAAAITDSQLLRAEASRPESTAMTPASSPTAGSIGRRS